MILTDSQRILKLDQKVVKFYLRYKLSSWLSSQHQNPAKHISSESFVLLSLFILKYAWQRSSIWISKRYREPLVITAKRALTYFLQKILHYVLLLSLAVLPAWNPQKMDRYCQYRTRFNILNTSLCWNHFTLLSLPASFLEPSPSAALGNRGDSHSDCWQKWAEVSILLNLTVLGDLPAYHSIPPASHRNCQRPGRRNMNGGSV